MTSLVRHRLFWPVAALVTLVVVNSVARPAFLRITVRDAQL
jgi:simple sugar transport system permease protein